MAILYRLKTGCQWRKLPIQAFFSVPNFSWNHVFQHFNNWSKFGCWRKVCMNLLRAKCQLYKNRSVIEHTNAWMDSFKTLLIRFETSTQNWTSFFLIDFIAIFFSQIGQKK